MPRCCARFGALFEAHMLRFLRNSKRVGFGSVAGIRLQGPHVVFGPCSCQKLPAAPSVEGPTAVAPGSLHLQYDESLEGAAPGAGSE